VIISEKLLIKKMLVFCKTSILNTLFYDKILVLTI